METSAGETNQGLRFQKAAHYFEGSRRQALQKLKSFTPRMGKQYQSLRNYDYGPEDRANISLLSPHIRMRQLLEQEVIRAALQEHGFKQAEKFIQEVFWRSYWKGWLALRPRVWTDYLVELSSLSRRLSDDEQLAGVYEQALSSNTRIDCFDYWVEELRQTGYLHNHARMWFASIWIHYLQIPWQLGANFFMQQLLDADAASNTLSWRWVAGLQTRGKQYVASRDNIQKFTAGRFLAEGLDFWPIDDSFPADSELPEIQTEAPAVQDVPNEPALLLLHDEDLLPELSPLSRANISAIAVLPPEVVGERVGVSQRVLRFRRAALEDCQQRAEQFFQVKSVNLNCLQSLESGLLKAGEMFDRRVLYLRPGVGYTSQLLLETEEKVKPEGFEFISVQRPWDAEIYPHATHGYFRFAKQIPKLIKRLGPFHEAAEI